jgi:hypothetical protein
MLYEKYEMCVCAIFYELHAYMSFCTTTCYYDSILKWLSWGFRNVSPHVNLHCTIISGKSHQQKFYSVTTVISQINRKC